jgi:hypothetical protein
MTNSLLPARAKTVRNLIMPAVFEGHREEKGTGNKAVATFCHHPLNITALLSTNFTQFEGSTYAKAMPYTQLKA